MDFKTSQMESISGDCASKDRLTVTCTPDAVLMVAFKEYVSGGTYTLCQSSVNTGPAAGCSSKEQLHSVVSGLNVSPKGFVMEVRAPPVLVGGQAW